MSENQTPQGATDEEQQQFFMQKIYIKDISFETPNSPSVFTDKWEPNVNVELNTSGNEISEDVHEVVLGITVTAKLEEKVAYLVEIHQAGIFTINGFADEEKAAMLGSFCPNVLFPYAREAVSDLVARGGFPQLLLAPVNFDAIYQDHLRRTQEQSGTSESVH